ncbi:putative geranylgeranyl pyrophosphate synthetase [Rosellinia necatrix]|uniref:Putative geranylgeranyl pyrophosphate synthetase n=1 Tax=Rosellinia necatrix TaxID=77044 RepID=A0A1W2TUP6_ROSNE|nr:putative geranylgeranyl pyrophosphate synthetase [Rosellinia necatrix]
MESGAQPPVSSPWAPLKSSLRPLFDSIYPHQRRPTGLLTPTPMPLQQKTQQAVYPGLAKADSPMAQVNAQKAPQASQASESTQAAFGDDMQLGNGWTWTAQKEKIILSPYDYIASEPGKEFRTLLLNAFNAWLEVPAENLAIITKVVRMLHTSSLLIDDIQDNSMLRRGRPVAHNIFGVAQTINAGNYVYFLALKELQKLSNPAKAMDIYTTEMLYLHRGQGMDLYWRDTLTCPTEDDYLEMVSNKTGGLFRLAVKLMQSQSPTSFDCLPLAELLGQAFQIADDYKNLANLDYTQKKGLCEDLTEGKFSFPVIHSIRSNPENQELLHILAQRPTDVDTKKYAVKYIESTGSLEYTKQLVEILLAKAKEEADAIAPGSDKSKGILMLLSKLDLK